MNSESNPQPGPSRNPETEADQNQSQGPKIDEKDAGKGQENDAEGEQIDSFADQKDADIGRDVQQMLAWFGLTAAADQTLISGFLGTQP